MHCSICSSENDQHDWLITGIAPYETDIEQLKYVNSCLEYWDTWKNTIDTEYARELRETLYTIVRYHFPELMKLIILQ
jgi:hypothetical protein